VEELQASEIENGHARRCAQIYAHDTSTNKQN